MFHQFFKHFSFITIFLLSLSQITLADDSEGSTVLQVTTLTSGSTTILSTSTQIISPTLVWVTGTDAAGVTQTTQSAYTETFPSFYTSVAVPPVGSIGLGSISGTIGTLRRYPSLTVKPQATKRA